MHATLGLCKKEHINIEYEKIDIPYSQTNKNKNTKLLFVKINNTNINAQIMAIAVETPK